jgi:hypothetical protein
MGDKIEISFEIQGVAMSLAGLGDHTEARQLYRATLAELERMGAEVHIRFWDALIERFIGSAQTDIDSEPDIHTARGSTMGFEEAAIRALEIQAN